MINILFASLNGILSKMTPREAFTRAREVLVPAMVSSWRFWPVVQLISYSPLIPVDFKLLWIDTMEILWVAYLSATVNGEAEGSDSAPEVTLKVPWGEGRFVAQSSTIVLDEPGRLGSSCRWGYRARRLPVRAGGSHLARACH